MKMKKLPQIMPNMQSQKPQQSPKSTQISQSAQQISSQQINPFSQQAGNLNAINKMQPAGTGMSFLQTGALGSQGAVSAGMYNGLQNKIGGSLNLSA